MASGTDTGGFRRVAIEAERVLATVTHGFREDVDFTDLRRALENLGDDRPHLLSADCWCQPEVVDNLSEVGEKIVQRHVSEARGED